ncbi:MAG TPA: SDR family oxidoreductase [Advenella sp.]|nr:SDR family oxidoreductase [Advenella sp.]
MNRLENKIAVVIGAGQSPGVGMGNGRATVLRFAQEGARILAVDRSLDAAGETCNIAREKYDALDVEPFSADVRKESDLMAAIAAAERKWGRIDVLHYNVGVSVSGRDADATEITEEAFDFITQVNLRGCVMACKHVLPVMRKQQSGVILTVSSVSAWQRYPWVAYKATKAAMVAYTKQLAIENAQYGIRANTILPGLIDTPMAVDTRAVSFGKSREQVVSERNARVPLRARMGTAWDVANAAVFLASDEAGFVTGVELPVDGGALVNIVR